MGTLGFGSIHRTANGVVLDGSYGTSMQLSEYEKLNKIVKREKKMGGKEPTKTLEEKKPSLFNMEDPFHSVVEPCHISSSQEDLLRNRPLTRQSDDGTSDDSQDSGRVQVESAGIIMFSLPESTNDETAAHDEFQTPPEEVQPASSAEQRTPSVDRENKVRIDDDDDKEDIVTADICCTDGAATVELGKDSDLDFSESAVKVVAVSYVGVGTSEVSESELEKFRVWSRESQEVPSEPPSKKTKIYEENLATGSPKGSAEIVPVKSIKSPLKSPQILNADSPSSGNRSSISPPNNQGVGTMLPEDSLVKKKLCFPESEVKNTGGVSWPVEDPMRMDLDVEVTKGEGVENDKINGDISEVDGLHRIVGSDTVRKKIEDLEKFKYIIGRVRNGPPLAPLLSEVPQGRRELPLSICGPVEDAERESVIGNRLQVTVLDILKILCGECDWNPQETEETDILEVAKKHGMTFPQPRWWSPSDSEEI